MKKELIVVLTHIHKPSVGEAETLARSLRPTQAWLCLVSKPTWQVPNA